MNTKSKMAKQKKMMMVTQGKSEEQAEVQAAEDDEE
jgi:hypothetical protein